jgi:hypothetical protein
VRDFGAGITAGLWGLSLDGGTAHAYQKSHNAFGSCLRCLCHNRNGPSAGPATKEVRVPKYATLADYEQNIEWNIHRWCGYYGRGI